MSFNKSGGLVVLPDRNRFAVGKGERALGVVLL